ncbi:NAD(P)/FAD-dependent oxidoreductase [Rhizobium sp. C4]|uniref:NAD(P)/FAD-dependent oxidoreductase n=1 Tax=Rhizobium sp. C4 TaxID=1349800 RepID=UPI001E3BD7B7|nr:FAD-dependent oxidoreductase [Rhizobium sp. C4]MCD2173670.1 FAD-dependent oxidoreductase [Rhizobium sp. C4]
MSGVVIIGAGHGGSQLAVSLRDEGYKGAVTLIDADGELPYHKPPLSKTFLKESDARPLPLRPASAYDDRGIERVVGRVTSVDANGRRLKLESGPSLSYEHLVFATGSRNRRLSAWPAAGNVFSVRSLADAHALRIAMAEARRVVIVGGGFIGLEVAAAIRSTGRDVVVLETADRVLRRVAAADTSAAIAAVLEDMNVDLITGARILDVVSKGERITALETDRGRVACDLVVVGIGADADSDLARAAAVAADNGVLVDEALRAALPGVWAIGDVANVASPQTGTRLRIESVQNATDQARHVAKSIATSKVTPYQAVPWFWSDIGPAKLQIVGLSAGSTERIVRGEPGRLAVYHLRGAELVAVETVGNPAEHILARRLLAASVNPTAEQIRLGPEALRGLISL